MTGECKCGAKATRRYLHGTRLIPMCEKCYAALIGLIEVYLKQENNTE